MTMTENRVSANASNHVSWNKCGSAASFGGSVLRTRKLIKRLLQDVTNKVIRNSM